MEAPNYIFLALIGVIGWFLRDLHSRFKDAVSESEELHDKVVKLEAKVERLDEKMPSEIANLEKIMELKFEQFNKQFEELTKAIRHAERTMATQAEAFVKLLNDVRK